MWLDCAVRMPMGIACWPRSLPFCTMRPWHFEALIPIACKLSSMPRLQ